MCYSSTRRWSPPLRSTAGASPVETDQVASTDDKTVPLNELVKHRQRAADAEARVQELQRQIEQLSSQENDTVAEPPQSTESQSWEDRVARIERQERMRTLMSEQGLDNKQAPQYVKFLSMLFGVLAW